MASIFGTDGVRGLANVDVTAELALDLSVAAAHVLVMDPATPMVGASAGLFGVLIAAGTIVLSASGTVAGRLGKDTAFALTLLIGIAVLFAGFLVASTMPRRRPAALHQRAA